MRFTLEALNSEGATLSTGFLSALVASVPEAPEAAPVRLASTRDSLTVELPTVTADGGLTLEAYELVMDDGSRGEYRPVNTSDQPGLQRTHSISNLTNGLVYRFKYRARNSQGWSGYSPVASLLVAGVPTRPARPVVLSTSASEIVLKFREVSDNGGSPILSYALEARDETTTTFSSVETYDGESMTHTLEEVADSLAVGKIHYFRLKAINDVGGSEFSDVASAALAPLPAQLTPAPWVDLVESSLSSMLVRWSAGVTVPSSPAVIGVTGYRLYMDGGNDGSYRLVYEGANRPGVQAFRVTALDLGILPGRAYRFRASALNYNGEGALSDEATLYMCLPPRDFPAPEYVSSTETTLTLKWAAPRVSNGCPVYKYQLFRDTGAGDAVTVQEGGDIEP